MIICLCIEHGDVRRQAIVSPHLHDVGDQLRLLVKIFPGRFTAIVGIVLEGHECQILKAIVSLQVIKKTSEPRILAVRIGPNLDVFGHAFKDWPTQLERRVNAMESGCEL